ncbi:MAG: hypothetical protein CMJ81_19710 [Planctomycetaceae bacterium]|nr:hypothetical protein [Planctomycetaceae bacterium]
MNDREKERQKKLDTIHEEIVAYLDGELDENVSQRVEQRLGQDPTYRRRLQQMERAWDCLDALPQAEVDESFTHSTVEMVALAAEKELSLSATTNSRSLTTWFIGGALTLAAVAAGFIFTTWVIPDANQELLQDLPMIENIDMYLHADNVEFLQKLQEEKIFM